MNLSNVYITNAPLRMNNVTNLKRKLNTNLMQSLANFKMVRFAKALLQIQP